MKRILLSFLLFTLIHNYAYLQNPVEYCNESINYGPLNGRERSGNLEPEAVEWYSVTIIDNSYDVTFSACNSDFNVELQIWQGCDENDSQLLYSNDNGGDCRIVVDFLPEGIYYLRLYRNKFALEGGYKLNITKN